MFFLTERLEVGTESQILLNLQELLHQCIPISVSFCEENGLEELLSSLLMIAAGLFQVPITLSLLECC